MHRLSITVPGFKIDFVLQEQILVFWAKEFIDLFYHKDYFLQMNLIDGLFQFVFTDRNRL
jgi:hypothetical protein